MNKRDPRAHEQMPGEQLGRHGPAPGDPPATEAHSEAHTATQQAELVHQLAVEAAGIGIWEWDRLTRRISICPTCARLLELPEGQKTLSEAQWRALLDKEDVVRTVRAVRSAARKKQPFSAEYPVQLPSGRTIWILVRGGTVDEASGRAVRITGIALDIGDRKATEDALRASEERFRVLAEASPDGILVIVDNRYVYANLSVARMVSASDTSVFLSRTPHDFVVPQAWDEMDRTFADVLEYQHTSPPRTWPIRRLDGEIVHLQVIAGRASWDGQPAVQLLVRDLSATMAYEERLRLMGERLKLALEGTGEGVWDWDIVQGVYTLSAELRKILGYRDSEAHPSTIDFGEAVHPEDRARRDAALRDTLAGKTRGYECEYRLRSLHDGWKWVVSRGVVVARGDEGEPLAMTGIVTDITARKESEAMIWRHANLDALTGLPNRRHFLSQAESALLLAGRNRSQAALLFIDLDGFKQVNDLYGHEAGDRLLVEACERIRHNARATDLIGRLGGDEFTVLLRDLHTPGHVEFVCQALLASLAQPFAIGPESTHVTASIGVALYPHDASGMDELLRKADQAMYNAKATGKNQFSYFTQEMDDRAHSRLRVSSELRKAIAARQLRLAFQPVVNLRSGRVAELEALLRWRHPQLGVVPPGVFIPIAEEAGLMGDIGNWVFREAASTAKRWTQRTGLPVKVAINKSPSQFNRRFLEQDWLHYLEESDIPPASIIVEITEGMLLDASTQVNDKLLEYRDAGIQVAIDDFGTGYSSMAYLQKFDIDYLKIDQSFVRGIPEHKGNCTIAESVIAMAHKLGLQVIAEGIETQRQSDFLRQAGCDFGQGYFYSRPLSPEQVERMLAHGMAQ